jgi:hypothetical protein
LAGSVAVWPTMLVLLLVHHAKSQFAHPRAVFLPRFARAHVIVLLGMLLAIVLVCPLLCGLIFGVNLTGTAAVCVATAAFAVWGYHLQNLLTLVASALIFSSLIPGSSQWWFASGPSMQLVQIAVLLLGWVALAAWLWRLSRLREEADDYRQAYVGPGMRASRESAEYRRLIAAILRRHQVVSWISDHWHHRLGGYHGENRLRTVRLLRYGFGHVPGGVSAVWIATAIFAFALVGAVGQAFLHGELLKASTRIMWLTLLTFTIMPAATMGQVFFRRRPRIAGELLFPLSRRQLLDCLLLAVAWDVALCWLACNTCVLVASHALGVELTIASATMILVLSLAVTFAGLAVGILGATWDSAIKRTFAAAFICGGFGIPTFFLWWDERANAGDGPFLVVSAIFATFGGWMLVRARRAWLNLELGL